MPDVFTVFLNKDDDDDDDDDDDVIGSTFVGSSSDFFLPSRLCNRLSLQPWVSRCARGTPHPSPPEEPTRVND